MYKLASIPMASVVVLVLAWTLGGCGEAPLGGGGDGGAGAPVSGAIVNLEEDETVRTGERVTVIYTTAANATDVTGIYVAVENGEETGEDQMFAASLAPGAEQTASFDTTGVNLGTYRLGITYNFQGRSSRVLSEGVITITCGAATDCDDDDRCTTDGCVDADGDGVEECVNTPVECAAGQSCDPDTGSCAECTSGEECDDQDACTENDVCVDGVCAGTAIECDDGNPCTDDSCDSQFGCRHPFNTNPCDDDDACTKNDACVGGVCKGTKITCDDDGVYCNGEESCDPATGQCASEGDPCDANETCDEVGDKCVATGEPGVVIRDFLAFAPYVVSFHMRLTDGDHAIGDGVVRDMFSIEENGRVIDYRETNQFITAAPNLPLKLVLVLDYTESMHDAGAIGPMIQAAKALVDASHFTGTHHIGVVEFHDRLPEDLGYGEVVPLTRADSAGKQVIKDGIPEENELEHGLTRIWDAVDVAIDMLVNYPLARQDGEVWAIVFLSDGRDTTSDTSADDLKGRAEDEGIVLYAIGFGSVESQDEETMRELADASDGIYFRAADAGTLGAVFSEIVADLRGQWNLTYITQANQGYVEVDVTFEWKGGSTSFDEVIEDAADLDGDIHQGVIRVLDGEYDANSGRTSFVLKAEYMPRSIREFEFRFGHTDVEFVVQGSGGLCNGWTQTFPGPGSSQCDPFPMTGSELEYGAFGNIGIVSVPGMQAALRVSHNDSIYSTLAEPKSLTFTGDRMPSGCP